jgi:deazaflavin-dependent oxidoreductase (nitroreductase family)
MTNVLWRGFSRIVSIRWLSWILMKVATHVDRSLMKLTRGAVRLSFVIPTLLLRCTGAKSGRLREVPLLYVLDEDSVLLVGSNGGAVAEPAWCANLRAQPRVECLIRRRMQAYRAVELSGAARAEAFQKAQSVYPGYTRYQQRLTREIPVFRLINVDTEESR